MKKLIFLITLFVFKISYSQTTVNGLIASNTTWNSLGSPYLITGNTLVNTDVTLNIEAGVIIKFSENVVLRIDGKITAKGELNKEILFTSVSGNPQKGDWGNILLTDNSSDVVFDNGVYVSGSVFRYCIFEYGGSLNKGIVAIENSYHFLENCIVRNSLSDGVNVNHGSIYLIRSEVYNNSNKGLFFYRYPPADITVLDNKIFNNFNGGLHFENIHDSNTLVSIKNNTIENNQGTGGIHFNEGQNTSIQIEENNIHNNTSEKGGAFYSEGGEITFYCNDVKNNRASTGAAISIDGDFASHNYNISENYFYDNIGISNVVDIWFLVTNYSTTINLKENIFINNSASNNLFGFTGTAGSDKVFFDISKNEIKENTATYLVDVAYFRGNISFNNFYNNMSQAVLKNSNQISYISGNLNATNNYWGTNISGEIQTKIIDFFDDGNLSVVNFSDYLSDKQEIVYDCVKLNNTLNLDENKVEKENFLIYPNPTSGLLSIEVLGLKKVEVYNSIGLRVKSTDNNIIDLSGFSKGIYFISITTNNGNSTRKIVLK